MSTLKRNLALMLILSVVCSLLSGCFGPESSYKKGVHLLAKGDYAGATEKFTEAGDYENAKLYLMYIKSIQMAEEGQFSYAIESFKTLNTFLDSRMLAAYYEGRNFESKDEYENAEATYKTIAAFKDVSERLSMLPDLITKRDFETAVRLMNETTLSADPALNKKLQNLLTRKYTDDETRLANELYVSANQALANKAYLGAIAAFESLDEISHPGCALRALDGYNAYYQSLLKNGQYSDALEGFNRLEKEGYEINPDDKNECVYRLALMDEENGLFQKAHDTFKTIEDYKDAKDKASFYENTYENALTLRNEKKWDASLSAFASLGNYADSRAQIDETRYIKAVTLMEEGAWEEASAAFIEAGNYKDAKDRVYEPFYLKADKMLSEENWEEASAAFIEAGNYKDAKDRVYEPFYLKADKMLSEENWKEARTAFNDAQNYKDAETRVYEVYYLQGKSLLEAGDEDGALRAFKNSGNYWDAVQLINSIYYTKAERCLNNENWEEASRYFQLAEDYEDANDRISEPFYHQAEKLLSEGKWEEASEAFIKAGDFSDGKARIREPFYLEGKFLLESGDEDGAIEAFKRAGDYKDAISCCQAIYYAKAERHLENENWAEAKENFILAGAYSDAEDRIPKPTVAAFTTLTEPMEVEVSIDKLPVYKVPGEDESQRYATVPKGFRMHLIAENGTWGLVRNAHGAEAYTLLSGLTAVIPAEPVPTEAPAPVPTETPAPEQVQTFERAESNTVIQIITDKAPVYETPSVNTSVLGNMKYGAKLELIGYNDTWLMVSNGSATGYMLISDAKLYVEPEATPEPTQEPTPEPTPEPVITPEPTPETEPFTPVNDEIYVYPTEDFVCLYYTPDEMGDPITYLTTVEVMQLQGYNSYWAQVDYVDTATYQIYTGYVVRALVATYTPPVGTTPEPAPEPTPVVTPIPESEFSKLVTEFGKAGTSINKTQFKVIEGEIRNGLTELAVSAPNDYKVITMTGYGYSDNKRFDGANCDVYIIILDSKGATRFYEPKMVAGITGMVHEGKGKNLEMCDFTATIDISDLPDGNYQIGIGIQYKSGSTWYRFAWSFGEAYAFTTVGGVVKAFGGMSIS